jgi:hypothetical protein
MSSTLFGLMLAGALTTATVAAAQDPPPQPQPVPRSTPIERPTPGDRPVTYGAPVTVEGCLVREDQLPGGKLNIVEKAGITEDYVLTNTKIVKGAAPAPSGGATTRTVMYEVEGIAEGQLQSLLNQRVQIDGVFNSLDRAGAPSEKRAPNDDLVELRGNTIRKAAGQCARE